MEERSPSAWFYLLGVLIWFGGCCGGVGNTLWTVGTSVQDQPRGVFPGELSFDVSAGRHVIFLESKSQVDGAIHTSGGVTDLNCTVEGPKGPVAVYPPATSTSYSFSAFAGESLLGFEASSSGTHTLACEHAGDAPIVLSIGTGLGGEIASGLVLAFGAAFLGLGGIIVVFVLRRRGQGASQTQ